MQVASLAAFIAATSKSYQIIFHSLTPICTKRFRLNSLLTYFFYALRHSSNPKTEAMSVNAHPSSQTCAGEFMRIHSH